MIMMYNIVEDRWEDRGVVGCGFDVNGAVSGEGGEGRRGRRSSPAYVVSTIHKMDLLTQKSLMMGLTEKVKSIIS